MRIQPSATFSGTAVVPGDKSVTHRCLLFSAIAEGTSEIHGGGTGEDNRSTLSAIRSLGVEASEEGGVIRVVGRGLRGLVAPQEPIDCGNSGTTARLMVGMLAGAGIPSTLIGDESLSGRPMARVADPLKELGYEVETTGARRTMPLHVRATADTERDARPVRAVLKLASAQVKSCIMLSGLYRSAVTQIIEPAASRDHTERLLRAMGARVESSAHYLDPVGMASADELPHTTLHPGSTLRGGRFEVPGDISSAAFLLVAGLLVGQGVEVRNVGINPTRTGILDVFRRMGANVTLANRRVLSTGEPVADISVAPGVLSGTVIGGAEIPLLIDEIPVLAVLGAAGRGEFVVRDAEELRVKESDRVATTAAILRAMGVQVEERPDGLAFEGLGGAGWDGFEVDAFLDHRIGMAAAVAALGARSECRLTGASAIAVSYPDFAETMRRFGAAIDEDEA